jgi:hypothetical protein
MCQRMMAVAVCAPLAFTLIGNAAAQPVPAPVPHPTLPSCREPNQTVTLDLGTGLSLAGATLPTTSGTADPKWTVHVGTALPSPAYTTAPVGPWHVPAVGTGAEAGLPAGTWIQPSKLGQADSGAAAGNYVYRLTFTLPYDSYYYTSISLIGIMAADNSFVSVKLNGHAVTLTPACLAADNCFQNPVSIVSASAPWNSFSSGMNGTNTLDIEVNNESIYTGLYVQAKVQAVCSKCTMPAPKH